MIIHNKAKKASYPEHKGPLTIKCPLKGKETFVTPERKFIVDNDNYLILNDGQTYSCSIDSKEDEKSFLFSSDRSLLRKFSKLNKFK